MLVRLQSHRDVLPSGAQRNETANRSGIFERHSRALSKRRERRMCGISEERSSPVDPRWEDRKSAQLPPKNRRVCQLEEFQVLRMEAFELFQDLVIEWLISAPRLSRNVLPILTSSTLALAFHSGAHSTRVGQEK